VGNSAKILTNADLDSLYTANADLKAEVARLTIELANRPTAVTTVGEQKWMDEATRLSTLVGELECRQSRIARALGASADASADTLVALAAGLNTRERRSARWGEGCREALSRLNCTAGEDNDLLALVSDQYAKALAAGLVDSVTGDADEDE
jgi:hypothetical protein